MPSNRFLPVHDAAMSVIPFMHAKVAAGEVWAWNYTNLSVASGPSTYIRIKTGAKDVHGQFDFMVAGGNAQVLWFESPTIGTAGTAIATPNRNRNYGSVAPLATIDSNPTVTTVGSVFFGARTILAAAGVNSRITTEIEEGAERILSKNKDYLIRITAGATAMSVVVDSIIYEE